MSECRSCGAEVVFVPSAASTSVLILDAKPEKRVVLSDGAGREVRPTHPAARARVVDVYTDHHVTCPNADQWRGRTRKDPPT
ncbi:MAG: hypothetical protein ACRDIX_07245 [Actinomycetota bacterium]